MDKELREQIINVLLTTRGLSEGVTADAILNLLNEQPDSLPSTDNLFRPHGMPISEDISTHWSAVAKPLGLGTPVFTPELKLFAVDQPSADPVRVVEWKNDHIQFEVNDQKTAAALNRLNDKLQELTEENARLKAEHPYSAAASDPVPASVYKEEVEGLRLVIQTIADELGCGDEPRCKWIMQEIAELKEKATKPQRITEQDAREIITSAMKYFFPERSYLLRIEMWLNDEGRTLLAKLNEHREPDYKVQRDELLEHLYTALPFVEDAEFNEGYKPKRVADIVKSIRAAIAKASA